MLDVKHSSITFQVKIIRCTIAHFMGDLKPAPAETVVLSIAPVGWQFRVINFFSVVQETLAFFFGDLHN